uniref:Uncharacterized protein n=1 Tax=Vespula pensylvanica TaxID=30213 RepID=A0A834P348_VESPE|nr:hypothetical protein H0235_008022 [Vespula pensylvanica]
MAAKEMTATTFQHANTSFIIIAKEECASMLEDLSNKINNKHHEVHTHPLLSIFKMAEVAVKLPYSNDGRSMSRNSCSYLFDLDTKRAFSDIPLSIRNRSRIQKVNMNRNTQFAAGPATVLQSLPNDLG